MPSQVLVQHKLHYEWRQWCKSPWQPLPQQLLCWLETNKLIMANGRHLSFSIFLKEPYSFRKCFSNLYPECKMHIKIWRQLMQVKYGRKWTISLLCSGSYMSVNCHRVSIKIMSWKWLAPGIDNNVSPIGEQKAFLKASGNPNHSVPLVSHKDVGCLASLPVIRIKLLSGPRERDCHIEKGKSLCRKYKEGSM